MYTKKRRSLSELSSSRTVHCSTPRTPANTLHLVSTMITMWSEPLSVQPCTVSVPCNARTHRQSYKPETPKTSRRSHAQGPVRLKHQVLRDRVVGAFISFLNLLPAVQVCHQSHTYQDDTEHGSVRCALRQQLTIGICPQNTRHSSLKIFRQP